MYLFGLNFYFIGKSRYRKTKVQCIDKQDFACLITKPQNQNFKK
jgi:hypothetical protein